MRHKDVSDWIAAGGTADDLVKIMEASPIAEPKTEADPEPAADKTNGSRLVYFNECGTLVRKNWIMKGLIARGETSGWTAPLKAGKSALLV